MITIDKVAKFLTNQLKFTNWEEVLKKSELDFLKQLVPYYAHNLYYQNIRVVLERKIHDEKDVIEAVLKGFGGACITQNTFMSLLLKALAFDTVLISGTFNEPTSQPNTHVMCLVRINADELYLIDVGAGLPFPGPVPLHNLPYMARAAGNRYFYRKSDNGFYEYVQLDGTLFGKHFTNKDTEYVRYKFKLEPRTIDFFKENNKRCLDPEKSIFLQESFLFRYFAENEAGEIINEAQLFGDKKFILIRGSRVVIGTNETKVVKNFPSLNYMKGIIFKYFPKINKDDVEKALQCFNKNVKKQ